MEIRDVSSMKGYAASSGDSASVTQLYPVGPSNGLLALDLWEVQPGGQTSLQAHMEEHVLFVLSGSGEISSGDGGVSARITADAVVYLGPREPHTVRNTGTKPLRILVSTPLLVRSERMMGISTPQAAQPPADAVAVAPPAPSTATPARPSRQRTPAPVETPPQTDAPAAPDAAVESGPPAPSSDGGASAEATPDLSALMKRGSDLVGTPRPERRRPAVEPQVESESAPAVEDGVAQSEEDAEGRSDIMELFVAFDGGSRGNPGQGYGSYLVQSPGRKPVIKRVEFGDNYTNNQAEYDTLISCIEYIIARLTATGRTPQQVQLDIRSDSDLLVNQVLGNYKVKEPGLRKRHDQITSLLEQFTDWRIEWHPREESVRLLGH